MRVRERERERERESERERERERERKDERGRDREGSWREGTQKTEESVETASFILFLGQVKGLFL